MMGCFRCYIFIFRISPNLANYTYGLLPLEQHPEIEKHKNKNKINRSNKENSLALICNVIQSIIALSCIQNITTT